MGMGRHYIVYKQGTSPRENEVLKFILKVAESGIMHFTAIDKFKRKVEKNLLAKVLLN
jgi:hypothetical protein